MVTNRDDDYLICKIYRNHINDISDDYKDFITFKHKDNYYFAWVNDGKIILRSEAYPSRDKMERGIKAIIKNRDIHERYSIDSQHGAHFLVLWGGGNHQKHTGNFESHNEIGRSCPVKDINDLYALMGFRGKDFVNKVFHYGKSGSSAAKKASAVAGTTAAAASLASKSTSSNTKKVAANVKSSTATTSTAKASASTGGGFNWKWLLPLLLLIPLFFWWKGCNGNKTAAVAAPKVETKAVETKLETPKIDNSAQIAADKAAEEARLKAEAEANARAEAEAAAAKAEAERKAKVKQRAASFKGNKNSGF